MKEVPSKKVACSLLDDWMKKNEGCHYKNGWLHATNVYTGSATMVIHDPNSLSICKDENRIKSFSSNPFGRESGTFATKTYGGDGGYPVLVKLDGKEKGRSWWKK